MQFVGLRFNSFIAKLCTYVYSFSKWIIQFSKLFLNIASVKYFSISKINEYKNIFTCCLQTKKFDINIVLRLTFKIVFT